MDNFLNKFIYFFTLTLGLLIGMPVLLIMLIVIGMIIIEIVGK